MTCDRVTDLLPDLADGTVGLGTAALLRAHLLECADCADEWAIVQTLRENAPVAAPDLVARIATGVGARSGAQRPARWGARQLTVAATIAVALIGGAIAVDQFKRDTNGNANATATDTVVASANPTASPPQSPSPSPSQPSPITGPVLGNRSVVTELTETELEALLAAMAESGL